MNSHRFAFSRVGVLAIMSVVAIYFLLPLWWFLVASTKSSGDLFSTNGLWFSTIELGDNLRRIFSQDDGIFLIWMRNSMGYALAGAGLGVLISAMAGYALEKYAFAGKEAVFRTVLACVLIPSFILTIPLYLVFSKIGLVNTVFAVLLPVLINPFGIYLSRIYAATVPDEIIEAARIDGAGEFRIFFTVALPMMAPALATIFLLMFVEVWANFFLPQMMLVNPRLMPVSLGVVQWQSQLVSGAGMPSNIVICAAFVSALPVLVVFFLMQRFLRDGLSSGSVK